MGNSIKIIKYLEINITEDVQGISIENYKILKGKYFKD